MAKDKEHKPSLVELVARATETDLADIDAQIAAKDAELAEATKRIGGELDALKSLRRVVDVKLHGKPARKKMERKAKSAAAGSADHQPVPSGLASEIVGQINLNGPGFPAAIARKLDRTEQGIRLAVAKRSDLLKLLTDGRVALASHDERD